MYNPTLIDENRLGMASENTNFQQEFVAFLPLRFTQRQAASGPWIPGFTSSLQALLVSLRQFDFPRSLVCFDFKIKTNHIIAGFLAS